MARSGSNETGRSAASPEISSTRACPGTRLCSRSGQPRRARRLVWRLSDPSGLEMRNQEIDDLAALRCALGQPTPPKEIWQEPIDCNPAHLHALAHLQPDERAHGGDLSHYARDLKTMVVQEEFLRYALPFCLRAWREDLRGEYSGYDGFVAHFYPAL